MTKLQGKVAIITGAAAGMGASHAKLFIEEGASVVLTDVNEAAGQALATELGERALFVKHDVGDPESWRVVLEEANEKFGPVTILVNNAGIAGPPAKIAELTDKDYLSVISVDQHGTFFGMRAVIPGMLEAGGGSIVNISSVAGFVHEALNGAYTAAKFAVRGLTKAAAIEYADKNIRVNSVHPGAVFTAMLQAMDEETVEAFSATIPMRRMADPREISQVVLFLASDDSSYVTGAEHVVDGGALSD